MATSLGVGAGWLPWPLHLLQQRLNLSEGCWKGTSSSLGKCFAVQELMVCTWASIPGPWAHARHTFSDPSSIFEVCTVKGKFFYAGNHKVMRIWTAKPQRERTGRMHLFLSPEWSSLLVWGCRLGWAPQGDNRVGWPVGSGMSGFSLELEVLVGPSSPDFSCGMESRTVGEDWVQELPLGCSPKAGSTGISAGFLLLPGEVRQG